MKIEKIKSVPKYIVERIRRYDKENMTCAPGHTRFYSYLTKNDGELVKVTVAVRNHYKKILQSLPCKRSDIRQTCLPN